MRPLADKFLRFLSKGKLTAAEMSARLQQLVIFVNELIILSECAWSKMHVGIAFVCVSSPLRSSMFVPCFWVSGLLTLTGPFKMAFMRVPDLSEECMTT